MTAETTEKLEAVRGQHRDVDSFYHLAGCPVSGKACNGMACFVARHLHPSRWTEAERQAPRVYCLGQCFAGPAVMGMTMRPHMEASAPQAIVLQRLLKGGARTLASYQLQGGYRGLERVLRQSPSDIIKEVEIAELRGRGGAGFPTGRKWRSAASQSAREKYIIANADEGDPGAFIDRYLIEDDPHALLEGMLIAAYATGATQGWIYLRSEYPAAKAVLENALAEARREGLLGDDALGQGKGFDVHLHIGGGSYICGEETALIRSIEGKRPEPQARPPYSTEHGLHGRPTVMNNVETLVNTPWIMEHGGANYRFLGFSRSRGTKVLSLNSLFRRPGLYEIEFGMSVRRIVEELGGGLRDGEKLKGVIIGGPLAGIIPPHLLDTPFGFEELRGIGASVGHGGVLAFDSHTSIAELMHHVFAFGAYESCGKCTPCRLGTRRIEQVLEHILQRGSMDLWDEKDCEKTIAALKLTSLCGLGTGLAEFAESALRHYGKELKPC